MISYGKQSINKNDVKSVIKVLKSNFLTQGPAVLDFEKKLSSYTKSKYVLAVSSGTSALFIAAKVFNWKKGDIVIVSPMTFLASAKLAYRKGSFKYFRDYLGGLVEVVNPGAEDFIIASGCAVSQAREAVRQEAEKGRTVGLVKVKTIRPFPTEEILDAVKDAKRILIPEFNQAGWLHKEVCSVLYGRCNAVIKDGPRVFGGMTMPTEMVLEWLEEFRKEVK